MVAEILARRIRLAHNRSGANLVSGVASTLLEQRSADLGLFEVDEFAFPEICASVRPGAVCLGNLFRDQLDRYGELEAIADRWRHAVAELDPAPGRRQCRRSAGRPSCRRHGRGATPVRARRPRRRTRATSARRRLQYCVACGTAYEYAAVYVGHLGDYRCPGCGRGRVPPLDFAARSIAAAGLDGSSFDLVTPAGTRHVQLALPGLYNVYNAVAAASLAHVLGATLEEIAAGLGRFRPAFGRFERIAVGDGRVLVLLVENPAGRTRRFERFSRPVRRPTPSWRPQRRDRRRARRLVDLGRRLRAARGRASSVWWRREPAPRRSLCASSTAGSIRDGSRSYPGSPTRSTAACELTPPGRAAARFCRPTRRCSASADRGPPRARAAPLGATCGWVAYGRR